MGSSSDSDLEATFTLLDYSSGKLVTITRAEKNECKDDDDDHSVFMRRLNELKARKAREMDSTVSANIETGDAAGSNVAGNGQAEAEAEKQGPATETHPDGGDSSESHESEPSDFNDPVEEFDEELDKKLAEIEGSDDEAFFRRYELIEEHQEAASRAKSANQPTQAKSGKKPIVFTRGAFGRKFPDPSEDDNQSSSYDPRLESGKTLRLPGMPRIGPEETRHADGLSIIPAGRLASKGPTGELRDEARLSDKTAMAPEGSKVNAVGTGTGMDTGKVLSSAPPKKRKLALDSEESAPKRASVDETSPLPGSRGGKSRRDQPRPEKARRSGAKSRRIIQPRSALGKRKLSPEAEYLDAKRIKLEEATIEATKRAEAAQANPRDARRDISGDKRHGNSIGTTRPNAATTSQGHGGIESGGGDKAQDDRNDQARHAPNEQDHDDGDNQAQGDGQQAQGSGSEQAPSGPRRSSRIRERTRWAQSIAAIQQAD